MKVVRKVLFGLFCFFFGFLLLFNIYQFACIQILGEKLATVGGYAVLEVVSGSMEPTIHVGDLIVINTKQQDYQENDIITFLDEQGAFVTHRILSLDGETMITKGDNNSSDDPVSSTDKIVGKYVFRIGGMGILLSSLRSPFIMLMIFIVGILICYFLSLDQDGNLILDEEEKEYQEFLKYQKQKNQNSNEEAIESKDTTAITTKKEESQSSFNRNSKTKPSSKKGNATNSMTTKKKSITNKKSTRKE